MSLPKRSPFRTSEQNNYNSVHQNLKKGAKLCIPICTPFKSDEAKKHHMPKIYQDIQTYVHTDLSMNLYDPPYIDRGTTNI